MNKHRLLTSMFAISFAGPAIAGAPVVVPANQFPNSVNGQYMQPNTIYKDSAVASNMAGVYEGGLFAEAIYDDEIYDCSAGQYLPAGSTSCALCPENHYCGSGSYTYSSTTTQGLNACTDGLISEAGSDDASDCHSPAAVTCPAGTYLPAGATSCSVCPENSYCTGDSYEYSLTNDQGAETCLPGKVSPQGSKSAGECGKIMRVGEDILYLTSEKQTTPALAVKIDGSVYYAKMTALSSGAKPMNGATTKSLRTKISGIEYSIHDNTVGE